MKLLLSLVLALFITPSIHAMEMRPAQPDPESTEAVATPSAETEAKSPFPASVWKVTNLDGTAPLTDHPITFAIDAAGEINGNASCNRFGGPGRFGEGTVEFGPLRTTRRACEPELMRQEQQFLTALEAVRSWEIADHKLFLRGAGGVIEAMRTDSGAGN